jgi:GLPGLI family protein
MKKYFTTVILSFFVLSGYSQVTTVMRFTTSGDDGAVTNTKYIFQGNKGLVELLDSMETMKISYNGGKKITSVSHSFSKMSVNFDKKEKILQKNISETKKVRCKDTLLASNWTIDTSKVKYIKDIKCFKATAVLGNTKNEVWFAPSIKAISVGGLGLPGLILEFKNDGGESTLVSIDFNPISDSVFNLTEGELLSKDSYFKIKSKTKESYDKAVRAANAEINKD